MSKAGRRVREIPITKFKANCLALVADLHRRGNALVITNHGRPVALRADDRLPKRTRS